MGKLKLTHVQRQRIAVLAFALAALMLLDSLYQTGMHVRWRVWIPATLAAESPTTQPADTQPTDTRPADTQPAGAGAKPGSPAPPPRLRAAIKRRNIMAPPKPKKHGMRLTGVLGNVALFNARGGKGTFAIEQGKSARGVKVITIDGYNVTIEYAGKKETLKLFPDRGPPGPPQEATPQHPPPRRQPAPTGRDATPQTRPAPPTGKQPPSTQPTGVTP